MADFDDSTIARFWSKVDRDGPVPNHAPELGPCWVWVAGHRLNGYGSFYHQQKSRLAHRVSWRIQHGTIPANMCVLHRCDNKSCVRPDHLRLGTQLDNVRDRHEKGRDAKGATSGRCTKPERTARGDRSGPRLHPERFPRGDSHWTRLHPERILRGDQNGARRKPHLMARGSRNGNARMTESLAAECLHAYATGETVPQMAARLSLNRTTLYDLVNGATWRHVEGPRRH